MTQIFPEWTNKIPAALAIGVAILVVAVTGFFWYYGSPWYTDVGYRPQQRVRYSHKLHAGDLGLDCRYCHYDIEISSVANIPPTQVCMNCHKTILTESERLLSVRESWATGVPIKWVRVHNLPDYAYFTHSAHLHAGVGCPSCHGNVAQMDIVEQKKPLSMGWCLECHRDPAMSLRPLDQITNMDWQPPPNQREIGTKFISERKIAPPVDCSGCHR
ncbi:MAG TPA: cytochrome C [candidate division Zixibacteria bacterium]|nr:cytochrome C [candidate division Zixibacteria bacterium]